MAKSVDALAIRVADIILSGGVLLALSLPMIILCVAIRLEDGGPILFKQIRIGRGARPFTILKFRTMTFDPARAQGDSLSDDPKVLAEARRKFATTKVGDSRITRVGKRLRSSHLDELPQFVNVLLGDMSIVGPRPDTPVQRVDYSDDYWRQRHTLRPGITGPAQLQSDTATLASRTALEKSWLEDPSFAVYIRTIFATVRKVARRTGN